MNKRWLHILKWLGLSALLLVLVVAGLGVFLAGTQTGSRWTLARVAGFVDGRPDMGLSYDAVSGTLLAGLDLRGVEIVLAGDAAARDSADTLLHLEELSLRWTPLNLLQGELRVQRLALQGLQVSLPPARQQPQEATPPADVAGLLDTLFSLPLAIIVEQISLADFQLGSGEDALLISQVRGSLTLDEQSLHEQALQVQDFRLRSPDYELDGRLRLAANHALDGRVQWLVPLEEMAVRGTLLVEGDLDTVLLSHELTSPVVVSSNGTVQSGLLDNSEPAFDLQHRFDHTGSVLPGQEMVESVAGLLHTRGSISRVSVAGDVQLALQALDPFEIRIDTLYEGDTVALNELSISNEMLELHNTGLVRLQPLSLMLDWSLNRLETDDHLPNLNLSGVQGNGSVELESLEEQMLIQVRLADLSGRLNEHELNSSGELTLRDNQVEDADFRLLAGENELRVSGSMQQEMDFAWSVNAPALEVLLASLSGRIEGSGTVTGTLQEPAVRGMLRGEALDYRLEDQAYTLQELSLEAAYQEPNNQEPNNDITLRLAGLSLPVAEQVQRVDEVLLHLRGEPARHTLTLDLLSEQADLALAASGGWQEGAWAGQLDFVEILSEFGDWALADPVALLLGPQQVDVQRHCWGYQDMAVCPQGEWTPEQGYRASLDLANFPLALLNRARNVELLDEAALRSQVENKPPGLARLQESFAVFLPDNTFIDGLLHASASISAAPGSAGLPQVNAALRPSGLRLGLRVEQEGEDGPQRGVEIFEFRDVSFDLQGEAGNWLSENRFQVLRRDGGGLDLQGGFNSELRLGADDSLAGTLALDFPDIGWVETLVPMLSNTSGSFTATGELAGSLARPLIKTDIRLAETAFEVPLYGLAVSEVSVSLQSEDDNEFLLSASAVSGEGQLEVSSTIVQPFQAARSVDLQLRGENFQVSNLDGQYVAISPDLAARFAEQALFIDGEILVPRFELNLDNTDIETGGGGVAVSRDVVVVNASAAQQSLLDPGEEDSLLQRIPVTGDITIILGEEVHFSGYGLDLQLAGELNIEQSPERPLLAYGEVSIEEGRYEMYGQRLNAEGKLIFFGNPANPALDISAYREVRDTLVGVQMSGTLRNIKGQLYSTPALPESEVLAMLITGKSFQNVGDQDGNALLTAIANLGIDQGQGLTGRVQSKLGLDTLEVTGGDDLSESSLGLGKYLTEDLFMRYDVGLFDRQSNLTLTYELSERLNLEVETGVSQSVDLTYQVEK